tara:strand:+ start:595 stop:942 length:348 start_codon:yes stop_codon:yes gene_type:complete
MSETLLKSTTRHVRIFTAKVVNEDLVPDPDHLTMDLDPDNEFIWNDDALNKVQNTFRELIDAYSEKELSDYNLRKIGSEIEGKIRQLLQSGELTYNPDSRVLNYSMGLPRTSELL